MNIPIKIKYDGLIPTPFIQRAINKNALRLAPSHPLIEHCTVTIAFIPERGEKRVSFQSTLELQLTRSGEARQATMMQSHAKNSDMYLAIVHTFRDMARKLGRRSPELSEHPNLNSVSNNSFDKAAVP